MNVPNFNYLPSRTEDVPKFELVREAYQKALNILIAEVPDGDRKTKALYSLDASLLQAVRGITEANR